MLFPVVLAYFLLPLACTSPVSTLAPSAAASSHNIYLLTCSQSNGRPNSNTNQTGIAFFNAPITNDPSGPGFPGRPPWQGGNNNAQPDESALISTTSVEGYKLQIAVWDNIVFSSEITKGARALAKGEIAGKATLAEEEFVCFRDGQTVISLGDGGWKWGGPGGRPGWGPGTNNPGWGPGNNNGWGPGGRNACTADYWCASLG